MADKFFAKQGIVKELREQKGLKQSAFEVSDNIIRKMETGLPVSVKSARKVAKALDVTLESLADNPEEATHHKTPEIDVRVDSGRATRATYLANRVTGLEIATLLESTYDQRFVSYGSLYSIRASNAIRAEAMDRLEDCIKASRNQQLSGYRNTIVASSIAQLIERSFKTDDIQTSIDMLEDEGIYVLAANVFNKDWYHYARDDEILLPGNDFDNDLKRFRTNWVTVFILTSVPLESAYIIASELTDACLEVPP